jgi:hypothetical protein
MAKKLGFKDKLADEVCNLILFEFIVILLNRQQIKYLNYINYF